MVGHKSITCDFCNSVDNTFIVQQKVEKTFSITQSSVSAYYKCNTCGLHFKYPRHAEGAIERFYNSEYHNVRYDRPLQDVMQKLFSNKFYRMLKDLGKAVLRKYIKPERLHIETYLKKYLSSVGRPTVLEIGCGTAPLLHLEYLGYSYIGTEPATNVVAIFNKMGYKNIKQGFAEKMDFISDGSVGAIICISSLLCVADIKKTLSEFWRVLKKEGVILVIDNNVDHYIENSLGSYPNYGFSKQFLLHLKASECPYELLDDYIYLENNHKIAANGPTKFFALKKV